MNLRQEESYFEFQNLTNIIVSGTDPESGKMNGGEGYDLTIIAAAVGVVVVIILFVVIGVKVFLNKNNNKKVSTFSNLSNANS